MAWFRLAHHQHRSLQECQEATTSSEFLEWLVYFEREEFEGVTKEHYYLASIAAEIRRFMQMFAKDPKQVSLKDCLIKFIASEEESPTPVEEDRDDISDNEPDMTSEKWQLTNLTAKAVWFRALGMTEDGKSKEPNGKHPYSGA